MEEGATSPSSSSNEGGQPPVTEEPTAGTRTRKRRSAPAPPPRENRRARRPNMFLVHEAYNNTEERLFQQALRNSRVDHCRKQFDVPSAPTYHPTLEEFKDPLKYILQIRDDAQRFGICKIVPPEGWKPPTSTMKLDSTARMPTKLQEIHRLQSGEGFDDGRRYNYRDFERRANTFAEEWSNKTGISLDNYEELEKQYWNMVEAQTSQENVEYANDLDTVKFWSGFPARPKDRQLGEVTASISDPEYYAQSGWNLNNLPYWPGSLLRHIGTPINGVNVPWLYLGMQFSSFCWHAEDNFLYSINYSHFGAPKQWYGIPGSSAKAFENTAKASLRVRFDEDSDLLNHMTTQISPNYLMRFGIPVFGLKQSPGEFVITFPRAFHGGFNYGFNCNEAVNFATADWLEFGMQAEEIYRDYRTLRPSVFSHARLIFTLCHHLEDIPREQLQQLKMQASRYIDEDLLSRPHVFAAGVRDLSDMLKLPANTFDAIDTKSADYDDRRMCDLCKGVGVFSAVACECSSVKVSCLRHYHALCKCTHSRKYMLQWATDRDLYLLRRRIEAAIDAADNAAAATV